MDVAKMRLKIETVYDNPKWRMRVRHMPDKQIIAIYYSFEDRGHFKPKTPKNETPLFIQQTLF